MIPNFLVIHEGKAAQGLVEFRYYNVGTARFTDCVVYFFRPGYGKGNAVTTLHGKTVCNPKDQYVKRTGRKMALRRALKPMHKEIRTQIWDACLADEVQG